MSVWLVDLPLQLCLAVLNLLNLSVKRVLMAFVINTSWSNSLVENTFWIFGKASELWWSTSICIPPAPTRISSFFQIGFLSNFFPLFLISNFCIYETTLQKKNWQSVHVSCHDGSDMKSFWIVLQKKHNWQIARPVSVHSSDTLNYKNLILVFIVVVVVIIISVTIIISMGWKGRPFQWCMVFQTASTFLIKHQPNIPIIIIIITIMMVRTIWRIAL